jgi:hypothetical protein
MRRGREVVFAVEVMKKVLKGNKQKLRALSLLLPVVAIVALAAGWSCTEFYRKQPALVVLVVGLEFFLVTIKAIICKMSKVAIAATS